MHCVCVLQVLKNAFSPESLNEHGFSTPGRTCVLVDTCLRERLGLAPTHVAAGSAAGSAAGRAAGGNNGSNGRPARSPARRRGRAA